MKAVTSIAPKHINGDIQKKAVESWLSLGLEVYSMNSPKECEILQPQYPEVKFIPTQRTMEGLFGKPYVSVNAILDWFKEQDGDYFVLINSDIELRTDKEKIGRIRDKMADSLIMCNRVNYTDKGEKGQYLAGVDVFFIHRNFLSIFPQSLFCLGQCHFDYWIPYTASNAGVDIVFVKEDMAYHKDHNAQYDHNNWLKTGRLLLWMADLYQFSDTNGIPKMSTFVYNFIYSSARRVNI